MRDNSEPNHFTLLAFCTAALLYAHPYQVHLRMCKGKCFCVIAIKIYRDLVWDLR